MAELYRRTYCRDESTTGPREAPQPRERPAQQSAPGARRPIAGGEREAAAHAAPARGEDEAGVSANAAARSCRVEVASYGGRKTVLIRAASETGVRFVALSVVDGFERSMIDGFIRHRAPGGTAIGEFPTREAALSRAIELCPAADPAQATDGAG